MSKLINDTLSKSGQLGLLVCENPTYLIGSYRDLKNVTTDEYIAYMAMVGDTMVKLNTGRVMLDLSEMKGFSLSLRAAAVNNVNKLVIAKAPYFVLAIIKGNDMFENLATQTALKMALPLSSKFLAGKMFENTEAERILARKWLVEYPVSF
ncbi:MAG: hypothetical protein EBR30_05250 [Cytophagia bacterium]|nr:hypothetical protein [Cytophagia bacterium]NBW34419.1 hypothetical protein [Cytophagia bacterium]